MFRKLIIFGSLHLVASLSYAEEPKKPKDSFHTNFTCSLPILQSALKAKGKNLPEYQFPKEADAAKTPKDVYVVLFDTYAELSAKYKLNILQKKKKADIVPGDVVQLNKDLCEEVLKKKWPEYAQAVVDAKMSAQYEEWKKTSRENGEKIVPGDVLTLAQHLLQLAQAL